MRLAVILEQVTFGIAIHVSSWSQNVEVGLIDKLCAKHKAVLDAGGKCSMTFTEDSPNLCDITGMCGRGHLRYERCKLPQLPQKPQGSQSESENRTLWLAALDQAGIESIEAGMPVGELVDHLWPSQDRIDECRTCKVALAARRCFTKDGRFPTHAQCRANNDAWAQKTGGFNFMGAFEDGVDAECFCSWDADISFVEDGQILDGHHRWAATWLLMHDADTPAAFRTHALSYPERFIRKKRGDSNRSGKTEALSFPELLQAAQAAHSKNPANCEVPANPNQAVCFMPCGQAFLQQSEKINEEGKVAQ